VHTTTRWLYVKFFRGRASQSITSCDFKRFNIGVDVDDVWRASDYNLLPTRANEQRALYTDHRDRQWTARGLRLSVRPSVRTSYSRTVDSIAEFCHRVNLPAACTDLRSLAVLLPAQTQLWSSRDSVVQVTDLHPINLASTLAGIQMSHWWWQEGHPAKTDPVHYRKVSLHM